MEHVSVFLQEVIDILEPQKRARIIDGTLDGGGHARAILDLLPKRGVYVGIDQDQDMVARARVRMKGDERFHAVYGNFSRLEELASPVIKKADGILFDLGMSSIQLEDSGRGFSFRKDEPLDMRYDIHGSFTAENAVNSWNEEKLTEVLKTYGEERFARRIAKRIVEARAKSPIHTTLNLVAIVESAIPKRFHSKRIHPATKTFQALRIAVNDELRALEEGLADAKRMIAVHGRILVITFHSLEDRIAKHTFRAWAKDDDFILHTKKPILPREEEIQKNPRARSAKLRVIEKR
ncbi:MAG: 16S rRNA (cytosine(1402)-N(4))-methyltransferase [Candidatus Niyogibacteria bacterium CG10_big_fil_rev_8_21_14_0_10_46_36]|uniref:Ribosomal RNA small subunit methyltransferase H n=1 Tax=Candidatus Niyogibacteria bacterium CG10_big_fil_rev_8_21_14_0_10_46_36 TaxID=1974726 RepID=A0A2H0TE96_9BACT|nr:MAG: 16S rRNA (cytosine(1402)-N(4))-methyltransferase [Candidatus Niyogibacteria bacterium CG10_big_fil_rev_8_21_14_0_10_46_36]